MKIIFCHQGKTGGSTMVRLLRNHFGDEKCYRDEDHVHRRTMSSFKRKLNDRLDIFRSYSSLDDRLFIHGHFHPQKYRRAFPNAINITLYRDPVQQMISLYYFWINGGGARTPNPYRIILIEESLDLVSFASMMCKREKLQNDVDLFHPDKFDLIGITEKYQLSCRLLKECCLPELCVDNLAPVRANPTKPIGDSYQLDVDTIGVLKELLAPKIKLYEHAVSKFENDCCNKLGKT